ncbi:MAG: hypothetical protein IPI29_11280 [Ignavibacteria bacterium]|nr:hypothetical protein [Ignavibacteria bacterium]
MITRISVTAMLAVISLGIASNAAFALKQPVLSGTLKPGGVSSRNMELLDVVNIHPEWHDQFETIAVAYPGKSVDATRPTIPTNDHSAARRQ